MSRRNLLPQLKGFRFYLLLLLMVVQGQGQKQTITISVNAKPKGPNRNRKFQNIISLKTLHCNALSPPKNGKELCVYFHCPRVLHSVVMDLPWYTRFYFKLHCLAMFCMVSVSFLHSSIPYKYLGITPLFIYNSPLSLSLSLSILFILS